jgi:AcrR family transcriptional regulator
MDMQETLQRLAEDRKVTVKELDRITNQMKYAANLAKEKGLNAPTIAKHLGVTKRTVYLWFK